MIFIYCQIWIIFLANVTFNIAIAFCFQSTYLWIALATVTVVLLSCLSSLTLSLTVTLSLNLCFSLWPSVSLWPSLSHQFFSLPHSLSLSLSTSLSKSFSLNLFIIVSFIFNFFLHPNRIWILSTWWTGGCFSDTKGTGMFYYLMYSEVLFDRIYIDDIILHYVILSYIVLYLYHTILYYIMSYYIISHYIVLYYIILYHIILYYLILYCIILHCTVLHYITLYYILLCNRCIQYVTIYPSKSISSNNFLLAASFNYSIIFLRILVFAIFLNEIYLVFLNRKKNVFFVL